MVKLWSIATLAAACLLVTAPVDAQNAAVHAPDLESRAASPAPAAKAATPAAAPRAATAPATAPTAATTPAAKPAAATTPATKPAAATTPAAKPAAATTPATKPAAATTPAAKPAAATTPAKGPAAATAPATKPATGATTPATITNPAAAPAPSATAKPGATLSADKTWVSNFKAKPTADACYRRTAFAKNKQCPVGYNYDDALVCWAQCPIEYPVQCGMECLPQNKDCTINVLNKVSAVATTAVKLATGGFFGHLDTVAKGVTRGVSCVRQLYDASMKIMTFLDEMEAGGKLKTGSTREQIKLVVDKTDFVTYDLPLAVATCVGVALPQAFSDVKQVVSVVKPVVVALIDKKLSKESIKDKLKFLDFFKSVNTTDATTQAPTPAPASELPTLTAADVKAIAAAGDPCGERLKTYVEQIEDEVKNVMKTQPTANLEYLQFVILNSKLVINDLPAAAASCSSDAKTQAEITTAMQVIVDKMIASAFDPKSTLATIKSYKLTIAQLSLDAVALLDPTGIASMTRTFLQPICGPTTYHAAIGDGPADKALGLETVQKAFTGATGTWKAKGDGKLTITFKSADKHDVKVNVFSGGKKIYSVPVAKGATVAFSKPLSEFKGKTLYLDRWRKGLFGIPGTGGGSLLVWIPDNAAGSLVLDVPIVRTKFFDKEV